MNAIEASMHNFIIRMKYYRYPGENFVTKKDRILRLFCTVVLSQNILLNFNKISVKKVLTFYSTKKN